MSAAIHGLGRTDLRFLLPAAPKRVALPGGAAAWADTFERVGLEVVGERAADLIVTRTADLGALPAGAAAVIAEGAPAVRHLRARGLEAREYVPLPNTDLPAFVVPVGAASASSYLVARAGGRDLLRAARNQVAAALIARGRLPFGPSRVAVGHSAPGVPFAVAAAREFGVPQDVTAALVPGAADLLSRGVLVLFAPGRVVPDWVIKFGRVADVVAPFDRDEHGLGVAASAGPLVAARVPRLLGRMELGGLHFSVETAAHGQSLVRRLESRVVRPAAKRRIVQGIATWMSDVAAATAGSSPDLADWVEDLRETVLPRWDAPASLADAVAAAPAVLGHLDPGPWNILTEGDAFTLLDWEGGTLAAPPLWDLTYFLAHAALLLDGADLTKDPAAHVLRVFQGQTPSSALVHECIDRSAERLALSPATVGALVATCWMHHGMSRGHRADALRAAGGKQAPGLASMPEQLAARWLRTPGLGTDWSARGVRRSG